MQGSLDDVRNGVLRGWAYDAVTKKSPTLTVAVDGRVIGQVVGTAFRSDLVAAGIGDGHHGFVWPLPDGLCASTPGVVTVRFADDGALLSGGERVVLRDQLASSEMFGAVLSTGIWGLESCGASDEGVALSGWVIPPFAAPVPYTATHNGVPFETIARFERADIAERFDLPGAGLQSGFRAERRNPDPSTAEHEFALADARTLKPFNPHHTMHYVISPAPIPEPAQRKRVSSSEDLGAFLVLGASAYVRIDRVLHEYFGKHVGDADAVLDWGCGCGRVFRYFPADRLPHFTGVDIDRNNIEWCRENYPAARFEVVSPRPATPLSDGAFDVVFGISVFTHLTEANHLEWLAEVRRITRPGAAVLVSVHGMTAWMLGGMSLERYAEWRSHGYLVARKNFDLDEAYSDTSLYYNSFVSRQYIFERWARYFRVLDVLDGAIANHQDLVVLERL